MQYTNIYCIEVYINHTDNTMKEQKHIVWLDVIRLLAILMVIGVHCIDPFYISPAMRGIPEYTTYITYSHGSPEYWDWIKVLSAISSAIPKAANRKLLVIH